MKMNDLRVLITDDNEELRQNLKENFKYIKGTKVIGEAASGEEAIEFVRDNEVDIVTMDIHMGGMDGLETMRQIHAMRPGIPIIVYTSDDLIGNDSYESGALYYITKPASITDIEAIVNYARMESHAVWN